MHSAEKDYSFAEIREMLRENALQLKELKISQDQTSEQIKQTSEQMKLTDEQMKRTDDQMKRTDEKLERIGIKVGNIANNNGDVAEEFFWNALKDKEEFEGIKIDHSYRNLYSKRGSLADEFDILLWNGNSVIIVETKYKVHPNLIAQIKEKKIPNFKVLIPERKDHKIYCAIAGFAIPEEVAEEAKEEGFFVLRQSGHNMVIESGKIKTY